MDPSSQPASFQSKVDHANLKLSRALDKAERALTEASKYPGLGILAGITKFVMGGAQAITAFACSVLIAAPYAAVTGDTTLLDHAWTHQQHGFGNMIGAVFESIPGVGTYLYFLRKEKESEIGDSAVSVKTKHEDKFMPYTVLKHHDSLIIEHPDVPNKISALKKYTAAFQKFKSEKGRAPTNKERHQLKKESVREARTENANAKAEEKRLNMLKAFGRENSNSDVVKTYQENLKELEADLAGLKLSNKEKNALVKRIISDEKNEEGFLITDTFIEKYKTSIEQFKRDNEMDASPEEKLNITRKILMTPPENMESASPFKPSPNLKEIYRQQVNLDEIVPELRPELRNEPTPSQPPPTLQERYTELVALEEKAKGRELSLERKNEIVKIIRDLYPDSNFNPDEINITRLLGNNPILQDEYAKLVAEKELSSAEKEDYAQRAHDTLGHIVEILGHDVQLQYKFLDKVSEVEQEQNRELTFGEKIRVAESIIKTPPQSPNIPPK